jgi:branched-subunit amino acid ABC-type transport system permease component
MAKFQRILLRLLAGGCILSLSAFGLTYIMGKPSLAHGIVAMIGFYGTIITLWLFAIHVVLTVFWTLGRLIDKD